MMPFISSSGTSGIYYPTASSCPTTTSNCYDGTSPYNNNIIIKKYGSSFDDDLDYKTPYGWAEVKVCKYQEIDATTSGNYNWKYTVPGLYTTANYVKWGGNYIVAPPSPSDRMKDLLKARQGPAILGTRKPLALRIDEREQRARETLRRLVGDQQFRRFLKHGFITIKAASGLTYQLFHGSTYTWQDGKRLQHLCVVLDGSFPPTDTLIVRFLMIMNNEQHFCQVAIKSDRPLGVRISPKAPDMRPLMDVFQELKAAA